ncbi:GNAT family N-acetyltransferase [Microscilla marina]|uniref:Acetyltransferase, gnat family, putative n=1 Tax=Microscilla marina ATCC 23134 TaxID=313606 RepID=A1ZLE6_MICM2|nr:GNAT family N-acetyltransferase [Microscilla marina]EAY28700.1 acetyltransferase, gnat family, putative [Microscilla marina ATCC 23134]
MEFIKVKSKNNLSTIYPAFYASLHASFDGMWDQITGNATHWSISHQHKNIGFYVIDDANILINFFLIETALPLLEEVFAQLLAQHKVKSGIVSTNAPVFVSACADFAHTITPHSYLFQDHKKRDLVAPALANGTKPVLKVAQTSDHQAAVNFGVVAIGADKTWLEGYYALRIQKQELFLWQAGEEIIGACEARKSDSQPGIGDVGMVVGIPYRRQGVGAYLLNEAKKKCYQQGLTPICSCEKENIGSRQSIYKAGFVSKYRVLNVEF